VQRVVGGTADTNRPTVQQSFHIIVGRASRGRIQRRIDRHTFDLDRRVRVHGNVPFLGRCVPRQRDCNGIGSQFLCMRAKIFIAGVFINISRDIDVDRAGSGRLVHFARTRYNRRLLNRRRQQAMHRRRILRRLRGHAFHDDLIISEIDVAGIALALAGANRGFRIVVAAGAFAPLGVESRACAQLNGVAAHIELGIAVQLPAEERAVLAAAAGRHIGRDCEFRLCACVHALRLRCWNPRDLSCRMITAIIG